MSSKHRTPARVGIEQRTTAKGTAQYRARVFDRAAQKQLRGPWTSSLAEARAWRVDALARLQAGTLSANRGLLVRDAVTEFVAGMESGAIRTRSGRPYKPSAVAGYRRDLLGRVLPAFGARHLREVTLPDVQRWADTLAADGLAPSSVRNVVTAMRSLYAWALPRGHATANPTRGIRLPTGEQARDRIASRSEAAQLVAALPPRDQAALGLALYAGLRLGELLALEWSAVDLDAGTIRVVRAWDPQAQLYVEPKSRAGHRTVPIAGRLRVLLDDHRVLTDHRNGLLFRGRDGVRPPVPNALRGRMRTAWADAQLTPLGLHEARHTYASMMIAAGCNPKTLSTFMGHASIVITLDRYGHLFPGCEDEAGALLDVYLSAPDP